MEIFKLFGIPGIRKVENGTADSVVEAGGAQPSEEAAEPEPEEEDIMDEEDIPEYEKQRMAQIAKNRERMRALGIDQLVADIMPAPQLAARRPPKRKRPKAEPAGPRRASLRQRGVAADGRAIDQELRNGQVVLSSGDPWVVATDTAHEPPPPREKHPAGAVAFKSLEGDEGVDEGFLELLRRAPAPKAAKAQCDFVHTRLARLRLKEQDVAKVTGNGITHLQWHPALDKLLLAAADKSGSIGLWDVERTPQPGDEVDNSVLTFAPHGAYISGLRWAGGGGAASRLFSVSYDGSMRVLDPGRGAFELVHSSNGEAEYSAFDCAADGNTGVLADNEGDAYLYDVREHTGTIQGEPLELHAKRINTVHFAPGNEHLFVTSSSDNSLAIWDLRKLRSGGKPKYLSSTAHPYTCQSAYFAPDGSQRVLSTSRDDTIKVWDGKHNLKQLTSIRHNNNTGRWIIPFRAIWSPSADAIVIGNMKRTVDIFSGDGKETSSLHSEFMTAISSRHAIHPTVLVMGAATASGRVNIYR